MKFIIAAGGTGGHLFPGLAVAEVMQERGHEVIIFVSEKKIDALATQDRSEFRFEKLPGIGMPKLFSPAIFKFLKKFNDGLAPCRKLYREFQPHAVLGMGGFTSTAPILAGKLRKIPTFVHESNAIPGKANRLNSRLANATLLGFEDCAKFFPKAKTIVTGTPLRRRLATRISREEALVSFGLDPNRKTLIVIGGSQGAHGINEAIFKALPALKSLTAKSLQMIHITGEQDEALALANYRREEIPAFVAPFCNRMEAIYSAGDLAISRSGAASLTELSHFGVPAILIPFPAAAENHQTLNAEIFERHAAALLLQESQTTGEFLAECVRELLDDPEELAAMTARSRSLAKDDAARRVVEIMESYCK